MSDLWVREVNSEGHPVTVTSRPASAAEILTAAANLDGVEVREAVPVLPGGPPRWLDAKGSGRYLVIGPLPDKETPK